jgi:hypothetical protein
MKNNDLILSDLANIALEASNLEGDSALESMENMVGQRFGQQAKMQVRQMMNFRKYGNPKGNPVSNPISQTSLSSNIAQNAAASFTITARRLTANIAQVLEAPIFGVIDRFSGYDKVLSLPAGVTVKAIDYGIDSGLATANKLVITYTTGAADDKIEITCQQNPYPILLEATRTDILRAQGVRLSLSDSTAVSQFAQQFNVVKRSMTGRAVNDSLTPEQYKQPTQFQTGIVDLPVSITVDKETTITQGIIAQAAFSVSFSFFAAQFDKYNAQNELKR